MATILIVDDEPLIRSMYTSIFTDHNCIEANNGRAAILQIQHHAIDLVITDLRMPEMNGVELIRGLKGLGYSVPIVVITASKQADELRSSMALEFPEIPILEKPFVTRELLRVADRILG